MLVSVHFMTIITKNYKTTILIGLVWGGPTHPTTNTFAVAGTN